MKVFITIILVQAFIVNAKRIPISVFGVISSMFSCVPFSLTGWCVVAVFAVTMIPVDMLRKVITEKLS